MIIVENFLPEFYLTQIKEQILSEQFPWHYQPVTALHYENSGTTVDENTVDCPQFVHNFFDVRTKHKTEQFNMLIPIVVLLEKQFNRPFGEKLCRAKANFVYKNELYPENAYQVPHRDVTADEYLDQHESFLFYLNDSDGDTYIFNEKDPKQKLTVNAKITPKQNTGVLFNSSTLHAGSCPRKTDHRLVLNFVFSK